MTKEEINFLLNSIYIFKSTLPKDIRKENLDYFKNLKIDIDSVIEIIKKIYTECYNDEILRDIEAIINSILSQSDTTDIYLLDQSRFSIVFRVGSKVLKIGFPKIVYHYPKSKMIIDSIIRKHYKIRNKSVLFLEVQEYCEGLSELDSIEKEKIAYKMWEHFRNKGIIWYDPKPTNIVFRPRTNCGWNSILYSPSSDKEKGDYFIEEGENYDHELDNYLIVDTDLFIPIDVLNKIVKMYKANPNSPFFENWKFSKYLEYEDNYLKGH